MNQRGQFRSVERFAIYYAAGAVDKLMQFDAVVLEPGHRSQAEIKTLQLSGVLVLAYVSVMEVHAEHPLGLFVGEAEFLRQPFPPHDFMIQEEYGNRMVDLTSSSWRGHLLRHVGELLTRHGYDGVFLDTIGDVEMKNIPNSLQQVEAATEFVEQVRKWFPSSIIVQNNGLEILLRHTAPCLDGVTWENPPLDVPESKAWVAAVAQHLVQVRLKHPMKIYVLFEGSRQNTRSDFLRGRSFAQEYGFVPYFSPMHYQSFHR